MRAVSFPPRRARRPIKFSRPLVVEELEDRCLLSVSSDYLAAWEVPGVNPAATPAAASTTYWIDRHANGGPYTFAGTPNVAFLGDSITDWFRTTGAAVWASHFGALRADDLGIAASITAN